MINRLVTISQSQKWQIASFVQLKSPKPKDALISLMK